MKTAILSDIHGNMEALKAVLVDIDKLGGVERYWCLGDTVDYGPESHQCLERVRQLNALSIIGNHDAAVSGRLDYQKAFTPDFIAITRWTEDHLTADDKAYLAALPVIIEMEGFTLVHGSPRAPMWEYLLNRKSAAENLPYLNTRYCLVGHTHVSACYQYDGRQRSNKLIPFFRKDDKRQFKKGKLPELKPAEQSIITLNQKRLIINPGAVGQQRAKDPRAAYAIYNDTNATVELRRVEYDVAAAHQKMLDAGMPELQRDKLKAGK